MSNPVVIYSPQSSTRLLYILDWVFNIRMGIEYKLTHQREEKIYLSYGEIIAGAVYIPDAQLLWQKGINQHTVNTGNWNNTPTLYASANGDIQFDIFSAIFFLITRYEEYYSYTPDKHERYPHTDSILYKNNWLERPIVDEWIEALRRLLNEKCGFDINSKSFSFLPTYDIDIAWSYKHKGIVRNAGGLLKDISNLKLSAVAKRLSVNIINGEDPYFAFPFMYSLHNMYKYKPLFFVLAALKTDTYDKNINPNHKAMQKLIRSFAEQGTVGIHPSYNSGKNNQLFKDEKAVLEKAIDKGINFSRQHFIRLFLPHTYRQLITYGITDDYSMGYGTHIGFRAGTGSSFFWYDIDNEKQTDLKIHPFCFMDSTAHYDMKLSASEAFSRLEKMELFLHGTNSRLITVFHNFSLGTDKEWNGWRELYTKYLERHSLV